ncbi:uncharacterized protein LOC133785819 [Humulus lupulus]|uniref:uncharacterized protein LOC133785819 n=1 Tax=Humulus lupulus TaxID=3486 RepID=UPI002B403A7F|nr:uncharacterized protein LOC133785819 [Humulus lupulus]
MDTSSATTDNSDDGNKMHLWGGIGIGILIVFLVAFLFYLFIKKLLPTLRKRQSPLYNITKGVLKEEKTMLRKFQLEEVVRATNNFSRECLLGSGAFGNVYKGTFDVQATLAIKRPHTHSYKSVEEFRNEVRLLSKVKHRNQSNQAGTSTAPAKNANTTNQNQTTNGNGNKKNQNGGKQNNNSNCHNNNDNKRAKTNDNPREYIPCFTTYSTLLGS